VVCVAGPQPLVCEFPAVWGWGSHGECKCDKVSRYRSVDLEIGWGLEIWHAGVIDPIGKYWYKGFCSRNKVSFCPSPMLPSVPHIASAQGEAIEVPYRHISVYVKQYGFDVKNKDFNLLKLKEELKVTIENSKNQPFSFNILSKNNNVSNINSLTQLKLKMSGPDAEAQEPATCAARSRDPLRDEIHEVGRGLSLADTPTGRYVRLYSRRRLCARRSADAQRFTGSLFDVLLPERKSPYN
jgi:hypothetical protein